MKARTVLSVALGLVVLPALAAPRLAQDRDAPDLPPGAEGPLSNDVFLPVSALAGEELAKGDRAVRRARETGGRDGERMLAEAFEAWRQALTATAAGETVWHGAAALAEGTGRLAVGVEGAVRARLRALSHDERASWTERFAPIAAEEVFAAGYDPVLLATAARRNPATPAAAEAAVLLADREIERGRPQAALSWCRRGALDLELAGRASERLAEAVERRVAYAEAPPAEDEPEPWRTATRLVALGGVTWPGSPLRDRGLPDPGPGRGVRPGVAFLDDGRLAVQTAEEVLLLAPTPDGIERELAFRPAELLQNSVERPPPVRRADGAPGWPLLPATDGRDLVLVQGRAALYPTIQDETEVVPNLLLCARPPDRPRGPLDPNASGALPELRWAVLGDLFVNDRLEVRADPALAELAGVELQPGPVVADGRVLVQARHLEGDVRAWLVAFDLLSGELLWKRFLAKGSDLGQSQGRFSGGTARRGYAAQPLLQGEGWVFAGTHLGAGFLVDPLNGEVLWALKNRRRDPAEAGWTGDRPPFAAGGGPTRFLWGPADSDRLYTLGPRAELPLERGAEALFAAAPLPRGEAEVVVGSEPRGVVVLGRAGKERTVRGLRDGGARPVDAIYLAREERFAGSGRCSEARTLACTDRGLYLFDHERELYLLDYAGLDDLGLGPGEPRGGEVVPWGDRAYVVGARAVWAFRCD